VIKIFAVLTMALLGLSALPVMAAPPAVILGKQLSAARSTIITRPALR
jgi:hypothetical protein